ncbi:MAG: hypothetical protein QNK37_26435 [Acidobacteriota bacterium]|nr:hypothetical protein [Acidobacteriota bacterium]
MTRVCVFAWFVFALSAAGRSQADFTRADVWQIGDHVDYFAVDATNAEPGPAGTGVTWDFSNLPRLPEEDFSVRYAAPSEAPNQGLFPGANMVHIQDAGPLFAYTFFTVNDQQFVLDGLDLPDLGVVTYSDKNIWLNFPLAYNETQADDFVGTYEFNIQGITGIADRTGNLSTHYDGFGTLILPDGTTVNNVRRLKLDQVVNDVINVTGLSITTRVETTTYHFFAEDSRNQVFTLTLADTTVTPPGLTTPSKVAYYRTSNGDGNSQAAGKRRGAHLTTQGGDFDSEILIRNTGDTQQQVTLQPYDETGTELDPVTVDLGAGATSRVLAQEYFSPDAKSFGVAGCDSCPISVGYHAAVENASTAQVHETGRFENRFYVYPGEWDTLFDGAALINAGDGPAKIDAVQLDDDGNVLATVNLETDLASGGKHLTIFNNLFGNNPNSIIELTSDQPMAVMILRISSDGRFLYQNLPLPPNPEPDSSRRLAHITSETGGFDTDIYVHNTADSARSVTLQPYNDDGAALGPVQVDVPARGTRRFAKTDLLSPDASHLAVTGSTDCVVTAGYRARVENASTAAIHEAAPVGSSFDVYPGEWDLLFDGFALVNAGDAEAAVTVTQIGDDGSVLANVTLAENLAPNAKYLGLLEGLIPDNKNSTIRIESTQPLVVLALRLSKDARFLYNNNPIPQ